MPLYVYTTHTDEQFKRTRLYVHQLLQTLQLTSGEILTHDIKSQWWITIFAKFVWYREFYVASLTRKLNRDLRE